MHDALHRASSPERLRALGAAGLIDDQALERGLALISEPASAETYRRALRVILGGLGVALALSGVIFFFAFNWADLHRLMKLGLIAFGLLLFAVDAAVRGLSTVRAKTSLLIAMVLVGPLWAVFGQVYQSGADPWFLFALWALLTLPWALVSRFVTLWLVWLGVTLTAIVLYWEQAVPPSWEVGPWLASAALLGGAWGLSARAGALGQPWLDVPWARRLVASGCLVCLFIPSAALVLDRFSPARGLGLALYLGTCATLFMRRAHPARDLALLTVMATTLVLFNTALLAKLLRDADAIFITLVLSLSVGTQAAWMARWLRRLNRADVQPPIEGAP